MTRLRLAAPMLLCSALVVAQASYYWEKMPEHTVAGGYASKDLFFGLELVLVVLMTGVFSLIAARLPTVRPELFNIPNRDHWLAPVRAKETIAFIQRRVWLMGAVTGLFTVGISQLVLDTQLRGMKLSQGTIVALVGVFAAVIVGFSGSMAIRFGRVPK